MPVNFLSQAERERLNRFPADISDEDAISYFTLSPADLEQVNTHRGDENKLGWAIQLGSLRYLGFCPDDVNRTPASLVSYLAQQLKVEVGVLASYGSRLQTRSQHVREIQAYLGYREVKEEELTALGEWLVTRALEHDKPTLLLGLVAEKLHADKIVRPGITRLARLVASSRDKADSETFKLLSPLFNSDCTTFLDKLLEYETEVDCTRLEWLRQEATTNSSKAILINIKKLDYLRNAGVDKWKLTGLLNPNRRKFLAALGRKSVPAYLKQMNIARRYPILLALVVQSLEDITDETLDLFIGYIGAANSQAGKELKDFRQKVAGATDDKVRHFQAIGTMVLSPDIADLQLRPFIYQYLPHDQMEAQVEECKFLVRPSDNSHYDFLLSSHKSIRLFSPKFLVAFNFQANPASRPLLDAIEVLREYNRTNKHQLSNHSTLAFVPGKWMNYVLEDNGSINKFYYELCVLWELRSALRAGNIWVDGSRRYADLESYLIPRAEWPKLRSEVCHQTLAPLDGAKRLDQLAAEMEAAMTGLEQEMARTEGDKGPKIRIEGEKFVLTQVEAEILPKSVKELQKRLGQRLPLVELVSLLIEVDQWTNFSDCFEHAAGKEPRSLDQRTHLYGAILAQACNMSLARMERASTFRRERLLYYTKWYIRDDTLRTANTKLVNYHFHLALSQMWGGGTLSSSDGQRFPVGVSNRKARAVPRYFGYGRGLTFYTWTSDMHSQYGSKPVITTDRDALYVLDEILNNETELPLLEHTTDTAGFTNILFGLFSLVGLKFSPRIRDIGEQRLFRVDKLKEHPLLKPLIKGLIDQKLIVEYWDELLRVAGSLKLGYVTASLLIGKLQSFPQQNALSSAIAEYGKLVKTIFIFRYYQSEAYRHRIEGQLNKGEGLHFVRQFLMFANQGQLRKRQSDGQLDQVSCLNLVTNCVVVWNTRYMQKVIDQLEQEGQKVAEEDLVHISPARFEHVNAYGKYHFNVEEEMARTQLRDLRPAQPS